MNEEVSHPKWEFRDLNEDPSAKDDYGGVTEYVVEHKTKSLAVRVGQSEGGHIMKCPPGHWQVNLPTDSEEVKCFESKYKAVYFAIQWAEGSPTE